MGSCERKTRAMRRWAFVGPARLVHSANADRWTMGKYRLPINCAVKCQLLVSVETIFQPVGAGKVNMAENLSKRNRRMEGSVLKRPLTGLLT